ncbi:unnamed protein product, partial [marine sediment metagenome]
MKRQPFRAGSFYEAEPASCRRSAEELVARAALPADLPEVIFGGLVPHAGWVFSGRIAAATLKALAGRGRLDRLVLFGADHFGVGGGAAVFDQGSWQTPLGEAAIDEEMAGALLKGCASLRADTRAHAREHSLEVQIPLVQVLCEQARMVPITVPPGAQAAQIGKAVGEILLREFPTAGVVGSTDLTHYGPQYGFTPGGAGQ